MASNRHHRYSLWLLSVNGFALAVCYICADKYGLLGGSMGLLIGQSIPMLAIVFFLLKREGLWILARNYAKCSVIAIFALPLMLNNISGLILITIIILMIYCEIKINFKNVKMPF